MTIPTWVILILVVSTYIPRLPSLQNLGLVPVMGVPEISGAGPGVRKQDLPSSEQLLDSAWLRTLEEGGVRCQTQANKKGVHSFVGFGKLAWIIHVAIHVDVIKIFQDFSANRLASWCIVAVCLCNYAGEMYWNVVHPITKHPQYHHFYG